MQITLAGGATYDTATMPIPLMLGIAKHMQYRRGNATAFEYSNGAGSVVRFVRAIRARMFRERQPIRGIILHILNTLDAPHCRCGKPGTRINCGVTFCVECGPPAIVRIRDKRAKAWLDKSAAIHNYDKKAVDTQRLGRDSLHRCKAASKHRS